MTRTASCPSGVRTTEGGKAESGSGQTRTSSSSTSYADTVPGVSPSTGTNA